MDKIANYQVIVKGVFTEYAKTRIPINETDPGYQLIFDDNNGHYLVLGFHAPYKRPYTGYAVA